jgi:outer membrane immunogenic protein
MKILLASVAIGAILTGSAAAADMRMPVKAPPAPVPVAYNWTGFYIGAHVGGGFGTKDWFDLEGSFGPPRSIGSHDTSGLIAGGQIGFNWQGPGSNWVLGVEAQASWADLKGDHVFPGPFLIPTTARTDTNFIGTIAGRIGYAWDRLLLYVKGGAAWAHDEYGILTDNSLAASADETRWGWMVGAGAEFAFGGNWSVKLEYNYMDFGNKDMQLALIPPNCCGSFNIDIDQQIHVVKFGINYRFGGFGGPVVARY